MQEAVQGCQGARKNPSKLEKILVLGTHTQEEAWLEEESGAGGNG